jgi:DNA end-binding protein Ku
MARSLWKGSIAFGLVQIPVALYSAEKTDELSLDWLDKRDLSPVGYERVNKRTGRKVEWSDIVKGYEHADGEYVILSDQDIEEANVEASHTLEIDRFVEIADVDTVYFERPYYVAPDKGAGKAFTLLFETLEKSGKAAVAKYVVRTRQHIGLIFPKDGTLVLMQLRYDYELRAPSSLDLPKTSKASGITAKERQIAKSLVESMSGKWEPEVYHDEYRDDLMALIKRRVKAGEVNTIPEKTPRKRERKAASNVVDLVALLKQSLEKDKGGEQPKKRRSTRKASSRSGSARSHASSRAHKKSA